VAVAAADRSDWPVAIGAVAGLAVLGALLLLAWARLLPSNMRRRSGQASGTIRRGHARHGTGERLAAWQRLLPAGPTGAVIGRELRAWRRDPARTLLLVLALLISGLNLAVPALAFQALAALPWVGLAAALIVSTGGANVYGDDGTALWLTRMVPGVERAEVRGRQAAWLLVVAPVIGVLTVALTAFSGQGWAWPFMLALLPAVLGGTAGLMVLVSVTMPVRQKDPHRRTGPFDTSDDPNAAGAAIGQQYLMLLLAALVAVPAGVLVLLGAVRHRPVLQAGGVLVGAATGVLLYWWGGRIAARRLAVRGAELMDLLLLGPQSAARGEAARPTREAAVQPPGWAAAATGTLWTLGIICVVPQGLVPIAFNLFGVDPQVKVWFAARYLPQRLQVPAAVGFIVVGALACWLAEAIRRRQSPQR
jgi:ABC-2 type transport system permease protein